MNQEATLLNYRMAIYPRHVSVLRKYKFFSGRELPKSVVDPIDKDLLSHLCEQGFLIQYEMYYTGTGFGNQLFDHIGLSEENTGVL